MTHHAFRCRIVAITASILLMSGLGLSCDRASHDATPSAITATAAVSATTPTPAITPEPSPTPTRGLSLPAESQVISEAHADLNHDGVEERVVTFRTASGDGLAIDDWQTLLPAGQVIEEMQTRVLDFGGLPRVLLFAAGDDGISHYLYIYAWEEASYVVQGPHGGPLDGQTAFRSAYYQPLVDDGDFNGTEEIVVFLEASNPNYLDVVFYEWDGQVYQRSTLFMAIPRRVPADAPAKR